MANLTNMQANAYGTSNPMTAVFNSSSGQGGGGSSDSSLAPTTTSTDPTSSSSSGTNFDWSSLLPSASTITGLAPYLAAGGVGLYEANSANKQNASILAPLQQLGQPLTQAGNSLLQQGMNGQLTPAQQQVVDQSQTQGQQLIDSAAPLASIANTAFTQYQAGQLQPGQQQQIDSFTAQAKQQLRQQLANSGITDSSILASQDAAIDGQALQLKNNLMSQNLQVGDQQFSQWLTTTQQGMQMQQAGKQYAVSSINNLLQQALGFSQAGMEPEMQAVQAAIANNNQLSGSISQLFQSLMTAYAKNQYTAQGGAAGAAGKAAGAAGAAGGAGSLYASGSSALARLTGGTGSNSNLITSGYDNNGGLSFDSGFNDGTSGYNLNSDGTVDTNTFQNFFYDPSSTDVPSIDFGGG